MSRFRIYGLLICTILLGLALALALSGCGGDDSGGQETATGATGTSTSTVPPRKTDVIVFVRGNEVWAINPNSGAERKLTNDGKTKVWPRLSPDGRQVLYQVVLGEGASPGSSSGSDSSGSPGDPPAGASGGVYLVPLAEGAGVAEQIHPNGAYPAWSPDGKSIAMTRKSPAHDNQQTDDIVVVRADNPAGAEQKLTDHSQVVDTAGPLRLENIEYSPDGKYIYFMRGRRSDSRWLARVDVASGMEDDLLAPPGPMPDALADGGFSLFNVSQMEGRRALIARGNLNATDYQKDHQLFIRFLEPRLPDSMIEESTGSINPSLKPDNTRFVYENGGSLYKHNLAGDPGIEKITDGSMPDWGMSAVGPGVDEGGDTGDTGTTATNGTSGGTGGVGANECQGSTQSGTEYVRNAYFESGLADWQKVDIKNQGSNSVDAIDDPQCGRVIAFSRTGSGNDGGMSALEQNLDVSRAGLGSLRPRLVLAIDRQDLSGDGWYGGESPVFITIDYQTASGESKSWTHGFLTHGDVNYPDRDQVVPAGKWYTWDGPDLLAALPDLDRVNKLTVGGNGWDFRSRVAVVSLVGE